MKLELGGRSLIPAAVIPWFRGWGSRGSGQGGLKSLRTRSDIREGRWLNFVVCFSLGASRARLHSIKVSLHPKELCELNFAACNPPNPCFLAPAGCGASATICELEPALTNGKLPTGRGEIQPQPWRPVLDLIINAQALPCFFRSFSLNLSLSFSGRGKCSKQGTVDAQFSLH